MIELFNNISIILVIISVIISGISLIKFHSILIKLVALEVLSNIILASIALLGLVKNQPVVIDFCLIMAIIMFVGVVAYYQFLNYKEIEDVRNH